MAAEAAAEAAAKAWDETEGVVAAEGVAAEVAAPKAVPRIIGGKVGGRAKSPKKRSVAGYSVGHYAHGDYVQQETHVTGHIVVNVAVSQIY